MPALTDNQRRSERAYRRALGYSGEDIEADITDLLCDLLHLANDYEGADVVLERALLHYHAEKNEAGNA